MGQSSLTLTEPTAADLTTKRYYGAKQTSTGLALCATAGERCDGVIGVGSDSCVTLERGPKVKVKAGASFSKGAALSVTAAGKFVAASVGHHVAFIADEAATADGDEVDALTPLSYPPSLDVESISAVSAPGEIPPTSSYVLLSVDGTDAFTLDDGAEGHEITIECITAANTPVGTVTLDGAQAAYGTEPTAYVFNGVGQILTLRMTSTGWKFVSGSGIETRTSGALGLPFTTHFVSVTGTVEFTLAAGLRLGQRKRVECSVAATSPLGTLTLADAFASESLTHVFTAVGQALDLEWTATGWKIVGKTRMGDQLCVIGTTELTGYDMAARYNFSVTGAVASSGTMGIPDGTLNGEFIDCQATVNTGGTDEGEIDITAVDLDNGAATKIDAINGTTAHHAQFRWDGAAWQTVSITGVTLA